ncbi:MAG: peptidylprolyl isomerase [Chitinivibrionales bacterium]|nr:peptidylprolyl isomerase [Chitinivibrionales bacterium]
MARETAPHTATSQFYINTVDNNSLNFKDSTSQNGWGYCVFGKVTEGMDVVDAISKVKTTTKSGNENVPVTTITITKVSLETTLTLPEVKKSAASPLSFNVTGNRWSAIISSPTAAALHLYNPAGRNIFRSHGSLSDQTIVALPALPAGMYLYSLKIQDVTIISGTVFKRF